MYNFNQITIPFIWYQSCNSSLVVDTEHLNKDVTHITKALNLIEKHFFYITGLNRSSALDPWVLHRSATTAPMSFLLPIPSLSSSLIITSTMVEVTAYTHFPINLTQNNFLIWRKQVLATLIGFGRDSYVEDSIESPQKFLLSDITNPNLAYLPYFCQDHILLGALPQSCSDTFQPIVSSAKTSRQAFKRPTESYTNVSKSHIISLKSRLANSHKRT